MSLREAQKQSGEGIKMMLSKYICFIWSSWNSWYNFWRVPYLKHYCFTFDIVNYTMVLINQSKSILLLFLQSSSIIYKCACGKQHLTVHNQYWQLCWCRPVTRSPVLSGAWKGNVDGRGRGGAECLFYSKNPFCVIYALNFLYTLPGCSWVAILGGIEIKANPSTWKIILLLDFASNQFRISSSPYPTSHSVWKIIAVCAGADPSQEH